MSRPVIWSEDALADLEESVAFVSETNLPYAAKLAATVRAAGDRLGLYDTGRPSRVSGYREKSITDIGYILAYRLDPQQTGAITIVRVVHSRQNWQSDHWPSKAKPR